MHYAESPFALTEHAADGAGHFLFHTAPGMALVNIGLLVGVVVLAYKGAQALWHKVFDTRSRVHGILRSS